MQGVRIDLNIVDNLKMCVGPAEDIVELARNSKDLGQRGYK